MKIIITCLKITREKYPYINKSLKAPSAGWNQFHLESVSQARVGWEKKESFSHHFLPSQSARAKAISSEIGFSPGAFGKNTIFIWDAP